MSSLGGLLDIRPGERRNTFAAFATLLGITTGHTLLETARDTLFLARMPASTLPWMYLLIVAFALGLAQLGRKGGSAGDKRGIAGALFIASAVTAGFWALAASPSPWLLYALYVWSGLFASWVTVQVWTLLGRVHTMTQAKRLYGFIGAGAVLGAVVGAVFARVAMGMFAPRTSLLLTALVFLLSIAPCLLIAPPAPDPEAPAPIASDKAPPASMTASMSLLWENAFARRVLGIVLVSTITFTFADYLFKAQLAYHVKDAAKLGSMLATFYAVSNTLSLVAQLLIAPWVFRSLGVQRALFFFPTGLAAAAAGVVASVGSIASVFVLKGLDGAMRYSIHRTSTELLLVPVPDGTRERIKPIVDLVGSRGGQAIASLAILFLVAVSAAKPRTLGVVVMTLSFVWFGLVVTIRDLYLDVFRETLKSGGLTGKAELPELDLGALETIFAGLNSNVDTEVLASLELLAEQHRERLIPALILYHPSREVVLRALEMFTEHGRKDFVPIADRLDAHPDREVAAAALRARIMVMPDQKLLDARLDSACPQVSATALVALMARDWITKDDAERRLAALLASGHWQPLAELARAIRGLASGKRVAEAFQGRFDEILVALSEKARTLRYAVPVDAEVAKARIEIADSENAAEALILLEVARAMGVRKDPKFLPELIAMMSVHELRATAREAMRAIPGALEALDLAMSAPQLPRDVKIHVPRAMCLFDPKEASRLLEKQLLHHEDGAIRYRVIRALIKLRRQTPGLVLDEGPLLRTIELTIDHTTELRRWGGALASPPDAATDGELRAAHHLLRDLVRDKEVHATQRLFLLLELVYREDFEDVWRGLRSRNPKARASGLELVENIVKPPFRARVLGLVGDAPLAVDPMSYEDALREILERAGSTMRTLAEYRAVEVGIDVTALRRRSVGASELAQSLGKRSSKFLEAMVGGPSRVPA